VITFIVCQEECNAVWNRIIDVIERINVDNDHGDDQDEENGIVMKRERERERVFLLTVVGRRST